MKELITEIFIEAEPEKVWTVFIDWEKYPEWNPLILSIKGKAIEGEIITVKLKLENQKPQTFTPRILSLKENKEFIWRGHLLSTSIFAGEHYFILEAVDNGTKFIHGEKFGGILSGLILKMIGEKTKKGFEAMNQALKSRVEAN